MSGVGAGPISPAAAGSSPRVRRLAPTAVAAGLALGYVLASPPSLDLAAHLLRAKLFDAEGFGLWNNWWYGGHDVLGYSVLFPPLAAALTPQAVAAIAMVAAVALFDLVVRDHWSDGTELAALWFASAAASNLYGGRLAFTFGLLPATACVLALGRGRAWLAGGAAVLTALASPVAALFAALAGAGAAGGALWPQRPSATLPGALVLAGALVPVGLLAVAFPEGGTQPFAASSLWPALAITVVAWVALRDRGPAVHVALALYLIGCIVAYVAGTPVGSNAARLAPLLAGSTAALAWWGRRPLLVAAVALPVLFFQWEVPIRDIARGSEDASTTTGYYAPLLRFLAHQGAQPFRIEIPPTRFHYETYEVAPRYVLARGWERQLDVKYNGLFYDAQPLTAATYDAWLHALAVRFVAVADAPPDFSAVAEGRLIAGGLPYLREVFRSAHWRVYAVAEPAPIVTGAATLDAIGPNGLTLTVHRPGAALVRVRFTPYWALSGVPGCVARAGDFTSLALRAAGPARLEIRFSFDRIGAGSRRCN